MKIKNLKYIVYVIALIYIFILTMLDTLVGSAVEFSLCLQLG